MHLLRRFAVGLLILGGCLHTASAAEIASPEAPKWEMGIGFISQYAADYRGAKHASLRALVLPYVLYNGKIFKVERTGVKGQLYANRRVELNLSVDGALSGDSDDSNPRRGMPDLDPIVEIGPSVDINLTGQDFSEGWSMRLPLRWALALSSSGIEGVGMVFNPRLTWRNPNIGLGWRLSFNTGAIWADGDNHQYFYSVAPEFVTQNRPLYQASGGYGGVFSRVGFYRQLGPWRFGVALRYDNLKGATFEDSPLLETTDYASVGFVVTRRLWQSKDRQ